MLTTDIVIAIDGYSSCGKSTFAKSIAQMLGYTYIDSGAMYRATALYCMQHGLLSEDGVKKEKLSTALTNIYISFRYNTEKQRQEIYLNNINVEDQIRGVAVSELVSVLSSEKAVRLKMVELQQQLGHKKRIVMDGRDIGTVVFPDAELKIFMTADTTIRAQRRYNELIKRGDKVNFDEIKKNIEKRDYLDINRDIAPLKKATDAIELNNSQMTPDEQMQWIKNILKERKLISLHES